MLREEAFPNRNVSLPSGLGCQSDLMRYAWEPTMTRRAPYSTTAIISISTIASGWARPLIWIVVLVGLATPK